MPKKPRTPDKRLPKVGDEILLRAEVTRITLRDEAPGDAVTFRIRGLDYPVTILTMFLDEEEP